MADEQQFSDRTLPASPPPMPGTANGPTRTAPAPLRKDKKAAPPPEPKDNLREVVETVVFVVVLVLILKSFAAEAFVIPTGSMAETLWGYQKKVVCPQCGFEFPVNISRQVDPQEGQPVPIVGCTCPNCRFNIRLDPADNGNSGDRVLVAKFLWDTGLKSPHRYDVTVFKYPKAPQQKQTPMNYIKRTAALGTETLGIYYGKLYVLPGMRYDESFVDPLDRWEAQHMHVDDFSDLLKHEREFQKLFGALLETTGGEDFKQAVEHRGEVDKLLHQLLRYRGESGLLVKDLEGGGDLGAITNRVLEDSLRLREALEKHPDVETIFANLRDENKAMDEALGKLAGKLKERRDGEAFERLLHNDTQAKTLLATLLDHREELKNLSDRDQLRFQILRRSPDVLLAMRRIVFDNDSQPKDLAAQPLRWQAMAEEGAGNNAAGWTHSDDRKVYQHAAGAGGWDWLRYQHRLRQNGSATTVGPPELITDFMGYNSYKERLDDDDDAGKDGHQRNLWVGDLMVEAEVTVTSPEGELVLQLSKGQDRFEAHWNLQDGTCELRRLTYDVREGAGDKPGKPKELKVLDRQPSPLGKPGTYKLRFANIDERLTVWVDGKLPFGDGYAYDEPERRGPYFNDLQPASVGAKGAAVTVQHLRLWRDTYYTAQVGPEVARVEGEVALNREGLAKPEQWGPLRDQPARTLYVQPGHYLCLGDNSEESSDSRYWGTVPERLLLGRALLIYYPFTRAGRIR